MAAAQISRLRLQGGEERNGITQDRAQVGHFDLFSGVERDSVWR